MAILPALLLGLLAAPLGATHPVRRPAPELPADHVWLYGQPFSLKLLHNRRAVIVAFLNTANINSLRAMDVLQAWYQRYGLEGLMVLGVHTPTLTLQRDPGAVRAVLRHRRVDFPMLLDNERRAWKAYEVEGWPALFLVDRKGRIVYESLGEGRYREFEGELRAVIAGVPGYGRPRGPLIAKDPPNVNCGEATAEFALTPGREIVDLDATRAEQRSVFGFGQVLTHGQWSREPDGAHLAQDNPELSLFLRLVYRGAQAFALLSPGASPAGEPTKLFVKQGGSWMHPNNAGGDIAYDASGRSYLPLTETRVYYVARNARDDPQELTLLPAVRDVGVHAFTFTDRCLPLP